MRTELLILAAISMQSCSSDDAYTKFLREFHTGADCPRLFELRNEIKQKASTPLQDEINTRLRSVQCFSSTSRRAAPVSPGTGNFTVKEYRIYRELLDAPAELPESHAIEIAARRHGVSQATAHEAAKRVQDELFKNNWYASPDAEIRHASDWTTETK